MEIAFNLTDKILSTKFSKFAEKRPFSVLAENYMNLKVREILWVEMPKKKKKKKKF